MFGGESVLFPQNCTVDNCIHTALLIAFYNEHYYTVIQVLPLMLFATLALSYSYCPAILLAASLAIAENVSNREEFQSIL